MCNWKCKSIINQNVNKWQIDERQMSEAFRPMFHPIIDGKINVHKRKWNLWTHKLIICCKVCLLHVFWINLKAHWCQHIFRFFGLDHSFRNNRCPAVLLRCCKWFHSTLTHCYKKWGKNIWYHLFLRVPICFLKRFRLQGGTPEICLYLIMFCGSIYLIKQDKYKQIFFTNSFSSLKYKQSAVVLVCSSKSNLTIQPQLFALPSHQWPLSIAKISTHK